MPVQFDDPAPLLAAGRQSLIVDLVRTHGTARIRDLAAQLGVSEMTVRRDIEALAEDGALERIHGGAKIPGALLRDEPGFVTKQRLEAPEKRAIAVAAARMVEPGMVVGLSAGTTTYALAERLHDIPGLTIVTNSIKVAEQFHRLDGAPYSGTVLLSGGQRTPSDALVGPIAVSALRQLHVDLLFLGVHGVHERAGFTTPNLLESEVDQVFLDSATRTAVLADHTKWGVIGMSTIAPLAAAELLVTDAELGEDARRMLRAEVGRLVIADPVADDAL